MKPNGGPAFPCTTGSDGGTAFDGMTLRDYFAAKAMQAIIVKKPWSEEVETRAQAEERNGATVRGAYAYADAMLAERERGK